MSNAADNYLLDLAPLILERAREAKLSIQKVNDSFEQGRLSACYAVLSLMKQQAIAFGLDDEALGLKRVNLEELLN